MSEMDHPLTIRIQHKIIAFISIAMVFFISVTSELHNHEDESHHSDCPACVQINHPAITTEIISHSPIRYQQNLKLAVSPVIQYFSFFFPQINPRAPPLSTPNPL
ncbi:MAG TPA: hypothetical protein VHO70_01185 [Chitinispirillaceae bacterium]|nr:hypothetical protein [Chitinispirillaceae bacterium]